MRFTPRHAVLLLLVAPLVLAACQTEQAPLTATPADFTREVPMAKRAPADITPPPLQVFRAFGTEPFWNVNVEDSTLIYSTPEDQQGVAMQGTRRTLAEGVEITGSHGGKTFALTVAAGTCSDGMSDNAYRMVATFRYGDLGLKGCGEAAK
jgi:uncharacterized membrane protein